MEKLITGILKEPFKSPKIYVFEDNIAELKKVVEGYIEIMPFVLNSIMIINKEGKLKGLPGNFMYQGDQVVGNALIIGQFCALSNQQITAIYNYFGRIDDIKQNGNGLI